MCVCVCVFVCVHHTCDRGMTRCDLSQTTIAEHVLIQIVQRHFSMKNAVGSPCTCHIPQPGAFRKWRHLERIFQTNRCEAALQVMSDKKNRQPTAVCQMACPSSVTIQARLMIVSSQRGLLLVVSV